MLNTEICYYANKYRDNAENDHYLVFAPAALFKMMMHGSNQKYSLASRLEAPYLKHYRDNLEQEHSASEENDKRLVDHKRRTGYRTSEEERAGISHKHLCGMSVVDKEAYHRADDKSAEYYKRGVNESKCHNGKKACYNKGYTACKAVESISKVYAVYHSDDSEHSENVIYYTELDLNTRKGYMNRRICISEQAHHINVSRCGKALQKELLMRLKALVLLLEQLAVVVKKSDNAVEQRQEHSHNERHHILGIALCAPSY